VLGNVDDDLPEVLLTNRWCVLLLVLGLASYGTGLIAIVGTESPSGLGSKAPSEETRSGFTVGVMSVPSPPRNLQATDGDLGITLTWEEPEDSGGLLPVLGYYVYRGPPDGEKDLIATVPLVTTYPDLDVADGETYCYVVTAFNLDGESLPSNEACATHGDEPPPPTVPGPPRNLEATPGDATVTLTWLEPEDNGGRPITNYHVYRGTSPDPESRYDTVGDVRSYTDSGVTNGVTYYYKVSAENEVGEGGRSNEDSATPEAPPTPPGPPLDLQATAGDGTVALSWSPPADDGGSPITNYNIWRGTTPDSLSWLTTVLADVLSYQDSSVTNGVTYYYYVTAENSAGAGPPSNKVSATPMSGDTVPDPPLELVAVAGDARVSLSWQRPPDGGSPITNYNIWRGTTPGGETWLDQVPADVLSYTDSTVTNGQTYYYYVTAVNAEGESDPSNEVQATPSSAPTVPDAVRNLQAEDGDGRVTLTWLPPANNGGRPITNYKVYRGTSSGDRSTVTTIGNVTSHTDLGLENGQRYYYVVSAVNEIDEGPPSAEVSATPATVPEAPRDIRATPGDDLVIIQWSAPGWNGGSPVTNYRIYRGTTSGSLSPIAEVGPTDSYVDTGRVNGQPYYYQVSAVNRMGEGPRSAEVSATPREGPTVPSAPQSLIATGGDGHVNLTWAPPATDGGLPITNYTVYQGVRSDDLKLFSKVGTATTLQDFTVDNGVTYYYQVTANNSLGEGPGSPLASATPNPPGTVDQEPSVAITDPASGEKVPAGQLTVWGMARDDRAVILVEVSADDGVTWTPAWLGGTFLWNATVAVSEGLRTILARATDSAQKTAMANLTVTVEPGTTGGRGSPGGGSDAPGPYIIVSAALSFAITAVTAWFFLNRRRTRY
jgi:fibronectin type 3 domain-containing protein